MKKILRELTKPENSSYIVKEEIATQFAAPFHFHQGYEFTYIVKGHGKFYGGDNILNFTEGDLYLFGIGFPHYFINDKSLIKSGELAHSIVIQFDDNFLGGEFYLQPEFFMIKTVLKTAHLGIKITNPSTQLKRLMTDAPKTPVPKGFDKFTTDIRDCCLIKKRGNSYNQHRYI